MLTLRAYLALGAIAIVVALALSLIAWGRERDVSAGLRRDLAAAHAQAKADREAVKRLGDRNSALAAAQAEACGLEGSAAFDRGVQVGIAVCTARQ